MKQLKHLSPSSITLYLKDREQFYLRYLSDNRPESDPQTKPMSVGSAFDACVKAYLRYVIFGDNEKEVFQKYFEDSVEVVNRDFALDAGLKCFENYRISGALADLALDLSKAKEGPKFEFFVSSSSDDSLSSYDGGVQFLGKPDLWYVNAFGAHVILDWKVNGYCSSASPTKGYVMIRDGVRPFGGASRGVGQPHKDVHLMGYQGMVVDGYYKMEEKNVEWARQLAIYSWLCGEAVGAEVVGCIDQIAVNKDGLMRVAEHRNLISTAFQQELYSQAVEIWNVCASGHYFPEMDITGSVARCTALDSVKAVTEDPRYRAMYGR